jgi:hypothetical protein
MNIPKKIKIGGLVFKVELYENLTAGAQSYGQMRPMEQKIVIDKTLSEQMQEQTFIHEILEVIDSNYELKLEHRNISVLEAALYQVIKDNPKVFSDDKRNKR